MNAAELLATEEARAMSGRPAWRVAAACIKGVACPRCNAEMGVRCKGKTTCRERVWRQRAKERAAKGSALGDIGMFLDAISGPPEMNAGAAIWWHPSAAEWRLPDDAGGYEMPTDALHRGIAGGLVRLAISGGAMPVWVVTERGGQLAAEWAARALTTEPSAQPVAPPVDAAAATLAFLERSK